MKSKQRNYQIDVLKFACAICVFFSHTLGFKEVEKGTSVHAYFDHLGWISVHIFFVISGFLMVKNVKSRGRNEGKRALRFAIGKLRRIAPSYMTALMMMLFMQYAYIYLSAKNVGIEDQQVFSMQPFDLTIRAIPELLGMGEAGVMLYPYNALMWYVSAMFLVMIPSSYLLIKNRDFFVYILSPVAAMLLFGCLFHQSEGEVFVSHAAWLGICSAGILRSACGIFFGVVGWILYEKLCSMPDSKRTKLAVTIAEILLNVVFFYTWIFRKSTKDTLFPVMLLIPAIVAVAFSRKSYAADLFRFSWMRYAGGISQAVFLNHYAAVCVIMAFFKGDGYWLCVSFTAVLTVFLCMANQLFVKYTKIIVQNIFRKQPAAAASADRSRQGRDVIVYSEREEEPFNQNMGIKEKEKGTGG